MKPKLLIRVADDTAQGDFIIEYNDLGSLQRSLDGALPYLLNGGVFQAKQLEFPLQIGGVGIQRSLDKVHFPGVFTVQRCLKECKRQNLEVVAYTVDRKTGHEFIVRRCC